MIPKHELFFQQWVASLKTRDRTRNAIYGNFEELFLGLKNSGLILESAYEYLAKAIKAHEPTPALVRNVYRRLKATGKAFTTEKEFYESWCKDIADKANSAFFDIFPVELEEEPVDPIIFGTMTAQEYRAQRRYAEEFPQLDLDALEKRILAADYNPIEDITTLLERKDSGDSN